MYLFMRTLLKLGSVRKTREVKSSDFLKYQIKFLVENVFVNLIIVDKLEITFSECPSIFTM